MTSWASFVRRVDLGGFGVPSAFTLSVRVNEAYGRESLTFELNTRDIRPPHAPARVTRFVPVPPADAFRGEAGEVLALGWIFREAINLLEHELREWVTLDGRRVLDPHPLTTPAVAP